MEDPASRSSKPVDYIDLSRASYDALGYAPYRWVENEGAPPWTPVSIPLDQARLALIGSGGIYRVGQRAYHFKDDSSYRVIECDTPTADLRATHFAYDLADARSDPNVVFPLETLRRLVSEGRVGTLCSQAFAFMGGIYSARKVRDQLAPALVERVRDQRADLALLVPV